MKGVESWWYLGHYEIEDAELSVPDSVDEKKSMRKLSQLWIKKLRKAVEGGGDPAKQFPWTREEILTLTEDDFYNAMLLRVRQHFSS